MVSGPPPRATDSSVPTSDKTWLWQLPIRFSGPEKLAYTLRLFPWWHTKIIPNLFVLYHQTITDLRGSLLQNNRETEKITDFSGHQKIELPLYIQWLFKCIDKGTNEKDKSIVLQGILD